MCVLDCYDAQHFREFARVVLGPHGYVRACLYWTGFGLQAHMVEEHGWRLNDNFFTLVGQVDIVMTNDPSGVSVSVFFIVSSLRASTQ